MELGVRDIDEWYAMLEGTSPIHYGATVGHSTVRAEVLTGATSLIDPIPGKGTHRAATAEELARITEGLRHGLEQGALGVGLAPGYTPVLGRYWIETSTKEASR